MNRPTLFIADLHLADEQPELNRLFVEFLAGRARQAEALYILGDLFEAWLGDDLLFPFCEPILYGLKDLVRSGVPVYLMHGNRDFLLGEQFCALSGCQLLDDPTRLDLHGTPTLLMHGDLLCSDDHDYQAMRNKLRNPVWSAEFLAQTPQARIEFVRQLREQSREASGMKAEQIMDVNQTTVEQTMREHGVSQLIHGHTHRPASHRFALDGQAAIRHVLPDWQSQAAVLVCSAEGCELEAITTAG